MRTSSSFRNEWKNVALILVPRIYGIGAEFPADEVKTKVSFTLGASKYRCSDLGDAVSGATVYTPPSLFSFTFVFSNTNLYSLSLFHTLQIRPRSGMYCSPMIKMFLLDIIKSRELFKFLQYKGVQFQHWINVKVLMALALALVSPSVPFFSSALVLSSIHPTLHISSLGEFRAKAV